MPSTAIPVGLVTLPACLAEGAASAFLLKAST
jgi:hypothetical protein